MFSNSIHELKYFLELSPTSNEINQHLNLNKYILGNLSETGFGQEDSGVGTFLNSVNHGAETFSDKKITGL